MSHFTVLVIGDDYKAALAPYDENMEVPAYERECWCGSEHGKKFYERNPGPCDSCSGTGIETTTYNPKSKWDWYSMGGRWRGSLILKKGRTGILAGAQGYYPNGVDQAKKGDIDFETMNSIRPFEVHGVVKNGEWHESGRMGWWAIVTDEKDKKVWAKEIRDLLSDVPDETLLTMVDCHI